jgi:hypothetical protein
LGHSIEILAGLGVELIYLDSEFCVLTRTVFPALY